MSEKRMEGWVTENAVCGMLYETRECWVDRMDEGRDCRQG